MSQHNHAVSAVPAPRAMGRIQRFFPWLLGALVAVYLGSLMVRAQGGSSAVDWNAIARLPVSSDGRVKPLDTFARNSLMRLSGRQTFDADGRSAPAIEWLVELMSSPSKAADRRVFRIDHPDLLALLGLQEEKRTRFSFQEISPKMNEIAKQADLAGQLPGKKRDPFQRSVLQLEERVMLYAGIARLESPYLIAPMAAGEEWMPLDTVMNQPGLASHASAKSVIAILAALAKDDTTAANTEVHAYRDALAAARVGGNTGYEVLFNRTEPFYQTSVLYVLAFILACVALMLRPITGSTWPLALGRATLTVLAFAFVIHTLGITARIVLQGRPPVTNLYSSAVFIGWACIPLALIGEWFFRLGIGNFVASLIGFATLIVAHNLSSGGDTMEMMQAVLDSNFWLATHVVVVTIGYSATFLAGFLAATYILGGVLTPLLRGEPTKALPRMIYGVVCFASVTSFVGTVLGGIWADQSWGRFWGWDPKENGAALIVVWNIIILHARWGGMIKERGLAVLAVGGNIVTAWSWFGTNMLGVGLHSYGFMDSAVFWLVSFCLLQVAVMTVAVVPTTRWLSLRTGGRVSPKTTPGETTPRTAPAPGL